MSNKAKKLINRLGVSIEAEQVDSRPDGLCDDLATHWKIRVLRDGAFIRPALVGFDVYYSMGSALTGSPDVESVMYSLLLDSDVDGLSFEEWASEYGLDTDSRKAERAYNACRETLNMLQVMFTGEELAQLREAFEGY